MIRRSLFLGLMIALGATLAYLILSARKQEKKAAGRPAEIIRTAVPSATRVLSPADIRVVGVRMDRAASGADGKMGNGISMRCSVTIQNCGQVAYDRFMIRIIYKNQAGRAQSRSQVVEEKVPAGVTVTLPGIAVGDLLDDRGKVEADIVWADLAPDASPSPPQSAIK
ncbi:MAG: hypothetical protein HXY20_10625 [Acidobacteria bacterium]|nr:hypothetical protein [Acidobacteriota bacterium]